MPPLRRGALGVGLEDGGALALAGGLAEGGVDGGAGREGPTKDGTDDGAVIGDDEVGADADGARSTWGDGAASGSGPSLGGERTFNAKGFLSGVARRTTPNPAAINPAATHNARAARPAQPKRVLVAGRTSRTWDSECRALAGGSTAGCSGRPRLRGHGRGLACRRVMRRRKDGRRRWLRASSTGIRWRRGRARGCSPACMDSDATAGRRAQSWGPQPAGSRAPPGTGEMVPSLLPAAVRPLAYAQPPVHGPVFGARQEATRR